MLLSIQGPAEVVAKWNAKLADIAMLAALARKRLGVIVVVLLGLQA